MAKFSRKRLGLVFAGGTRLSSEPKLWERVRNASEMRRWLDHVPELRVLADVEPIFITGKEATEIGGAEWMAMAEAIREHATSVDGFIILHGLETIHYSANALSLMVRQASVPIVFSGTPIPRKESAVAQPEFGARANIINAAQVATANTPGVFVVFGNRIVLGSQAQLEIRGGALQVIGTDGSLTGQVDFGMKYFSGGDRASIKPEYRIHLNSNILVATIVPGSGIMPAERKLLETVDGVVLRMHQGYFALPDSLLSVLERRAAAGCAIVVATPLPISTLPKSFIQLSMNSTSMPVVKTMWALGAPKRTPQLVRNLLTKDVAGELAAGKGRR